MEDLNKASEKVNKLTSKDVRILYIPPMTVAASHATGEKCERKAFDTLYKFVEESGLLKIKPDVRQFGFNNGQAVHGESAHGYEVWVSIPDDINVPAPLVKRRFHGGLYAAHMIKMGDFDHWNLLHEWVQTNGKYHDDWIDVRWTPFYEGMEHCLEEQLNFLTIFKIQILTGMKCNSIYYFQLKNNFSRHSQQNLYNHAMKRISIFYGKTKNKQKSVFII